MHSRTALLILCLVSGIGVAEAQKPDRTQKSDAAAQNAGPTIDATQQYITELLGSAEKARGRRIPTRRYKYPSEEYTEFVALAFQGNCKATYTEKWVIYRHFPYENGWERTTRVTNYALDLAGLVPRYGEKDYPDSALPSFSPLTLSSRKGVEDIPYEYVEKTEGEDKYRRDTGKPDVKGAGRAASVTMGLEFRGVYEEKSRKAFEHLLNECARRSPAPKELF